LPSYPNDQPSLYPNDDDAASDVERGADLSDDRVYRYRLWRVWDKTRRGVTWIMLNPSTADARTDDATVIRCRNFARSWGYGRIDVLNLFALRATDPRELWRHDIDYAVGPQTDEYLLLHLAERGPMLTHTNNHGRPHDDILVCAWGQNVRRTHQHRTQHVLRMLNGAGAFTHRVGESTTKEGQPPHPLRLRTTLQPVLFRAHPGH
jgi:hypothetical protein